MRPGFLLTGLLLTSAAARAEDALDPRPLDPYRLEVAGFPIVSYNSDNGLGLGVLGTLARYHPESDPYAWRIDGLFVANVRSDGGALEAPRQKYRFEVDLPRFPSRDLRLTFGGRFLWLRAAGYYGLGNDSPSLGARPEAHHEYEHIHPAFDAQLRWYLTDAFSIFGAFQGAFSAVGVYGGSKLAEDLDGEVADRLQGIEDHDDSRLTFGAMWDTRDHEEVPTRGMFHEASLRGGGSVVGGFGYAGLNTTARFYLPLAAPYLLFAQRTVADLLFGEPPFYDLAYLGDGEVLRGVPIGRFAGKIRLLSNFELRSRFLRFEPFGIGRMQLGAVAFADYGRVFADYGPNADLDGDGLGIKSGYGGGLRVQWGESFVARGDVAWSPDADDLGIYIGVAHVF